MTMVLRPKGVVKRDDNGEPILKACPFCGGEAVYYDSKKKKKVLAVACVTGCCMVYGDDNGGADEYWNYRTSDTTTELALQKANQEIERLLKKKG